MEQTKGSIGMTTREAKRSNNEPKNTENPFHIITLRGSLFSQTKDTVSIMLPCRSLTDEENKLLDTLFPHSYHDVELLLAREAILGAVVTERLR